MSKKTCIITGSGRGIGKACATHFARNGYNVVVNYVHREPSALIEELEEMNASYLVVQGDVSKSEVVKEMVSKALEAFGQIDVLINNAGNAHGLEPLSEGNLEDWDAMMDGNVKGLLYVSKLIIPGMKERKSGHIVNISSVAARQTYANGVVYCASKRAVDVISEGMRLELTEFGIKVTNIQPGAVETDFSKVRFKGDEERAKTVYAGYEALKAEDIADAIFYCVNAPNRVSISDLTIYPSAQSEPRTIYRN